MTGTTKGSPPTQATPTATGREPASIWRDQGEQVDIVDVTNGARLTTYVISGERGFGVVGINDAEVRRHRPRVVHVDEANHIVSTSNDPNAAHGG